MPTYRTVFIVPPDRYLCLQLPPDWPEGAARVVLIAEGPDGGRGEGGDDAEADREDIEWWEEFDDLAGAADR